MNQGLHVVACGMCCAVGHEAPAATAAIRARMNHFRETQFVDESGMPLLGATLFEVNAWGESRQHLMFQSVLQDCEEWLARADERAEVAIVLLCAESKRAGPYQSWAQRMLNNVAQSGNYHRLSAVLPLGKAGIVRALQSAQQILQSKGAPAFVIVVGVDSYLDAASVESLLAEARLATTLNKDGFIPGEAAAAVVLTLAKTKQPALWIEGMAESTEAASVTGDVPLRAIGLCNAIRGAAQDAGCQVSDLEFQASGVNGEIWYFREAGLAMARALEKRVKEFPHHMVSQFVGEIGAACAPMTLAWLSSVMARDDGPGRRALLHFSNDDGLRAALVIRYGL